MAGILCRRRTGALLGGALSCDSGAISRLAPARVPWNRQRLISRLGKTVPANPGPQSMSQPFPRTLLCSLALLTAAHVSGLSQMIGLVRNEDLGLSAGLLYTVVAALYCCIGGVLVLVARGVDFARMAYVLLSTLGLLFSLPHMAEISVTSRVALSVKALGLVLLYLPASNAWFRQRRSDHSLKRAVAD